MVIKIALMIFKKEGKKDEAKEEKKAGKKNMATLRLQKDIQSFK